MKPEKLNWSLPGAPSGLSIFCDVGSGMLVFNHGDSERSYAGSRLDLVLSKMRACTVGSSPAVVLHDAAAHQAFAFPEKLASKYLRRVDALSDIDVLALTPEVVSHFGGQQAVCKRLVRVWHIKKSGFTASRTEVSKEFLEDVESSVVLVISNWLSEMKRTESSNKDGDPAAPEPQAFSSSPGGEANISFDFRPRDQAIFTSDTKSALRDKLFESIPSVDAKTWSNRRGNSGVNASAALGKHRSAGRLFAVDRGGRLYYPEFQFTEGDLPRPVMKDVLEVVPEDARGWPLLSWFDAPNVHLDGNKPREAIERNPDRVLMAAQRFYGSDE